MTLHAVYQYILFRMHARGRHGTHSPFVYHFVELALRDKLGNRVSINRETMLGHLSALYGIPVTDRPVTPASIVLLPANEPQDWATLIAGYTSVLTQGFVVLPAIHSTAQHTSYWNEVSNLPIITMSIDLYHIGLVLSRPEFKEKQQFVLR
jgi:hypothetical protein